MAYKLRDFVKRVGRGANNSSLDGWSEVAERRMVCSGSPFATSDLDEKSLVTFLRFFCLAAAQDIALSYRPVLRRPELVRETLAALELVLHFAKEAGNVGVVLEEAITPGILENALAQEKLPDLLAVRTWFDNTELA